MQEIPVNVDKIFCEHIRVWVRHPCSARPSPHLIKELCSQVGPSLKNFPKARVKDGIYTMTSLYRMINIYKNKAEVERLKTQNMEIFPEKEEMEIEDEIEEKEEAEK